MADRTFIYALADPRTAVIRYIGKANNPWRRRDGHVWEARTRRPTAKRVWLRELEPYGGPVLHVLEEVGGAEWLEREAAWIALGHKYGWGLTNVLDSGRDRRGFLGHRHTEETKRRQAAYWRGKARPHTAEHRRNLSEAKRGVKQGPQGEEHRRKIGQAVHAAGLARQQLRAAGLLTERSSVATGDRRAISAQQRWRGEGNRTAKLTDDAVRAIRADTTSRHVDLARRYGVKPKTIRRVRTGEAWGHVQ